jgi:hypothetical protein
MKLEDISYENGQLVGGGKREDFGTVLNAIRRGSVEATETAVFCFYPATATGSQVLLLCVTPTQGALHSSDFLLLSASEKL